MTYRQALLEGTGALQAAGVPDYDVDALELLLYASRLDRTHFLLERGGQMRQDQLRLYQDLISRRCRRIPLQHITGVQNFCGYDFYVNGDVLIPRQDTETLVGQAFKCIRDRDGAEVLDLCTGSGCVLISLMKTCQEAGVKVTGTGTDLSQKALFMAQKNAEHLSVQARWLQGDLYGPVENETFDVIVSNPPYIPGRDIDGLQQEVRDHDPRMALDGGADGLDFYRALAAQSARHLKKDGVILVEHGADQAQSVRNLFEQAGLAGVKTVRDLSGHERVTMAQRQE